MRRSHPSEGGNVMGEMARNLLLLASVLVVLGMILWAGGW